jgi:hypothetical protein
MYELISFEDTPLFPRALILGRARRDSLNAQEEVVGVTSAVAPDGDYAASRTGRVFSWLRKPDSM